jgi:hypothetical protein
METLFQGILQKKSVWLTIKNSWNIFYLFFKLKKKKPYIEGEWWGAMNY